MLARINVTTSTISVNGEIKEFVFRGLLTQKEVREAMKEKGYSRFKILEVQRQKDYNVEIDDNIIEFNN